MKMFSFFMILFVLLRFLCGHSFNLVSYMNKMPFVSENLIFSNFFSSREKMVGVLYVWARAGLSESNSWYGQGCFFSLSGLDRLWGPSGLKPNGYRSISFGSKAAGV